MKILVIGAGLGGLALAQRLARAGFEVGVRERDATVESRFQGYRIGLSGRGLDALRGALPEHRLGLLDAIGGELSGMGRTVDPQLNLIGEMPPQDEGTLFDRHVLRHLLLADLTDHVRYGRQLDHYEVTPDDRVTAYFADGTTETADLLVGADGLGSTVRRQLLPEVVVTDMDRFGAIGRTMLTDRTAALVPGWSTMVDGPVSQLFLGKMCFGRSPAEAAAELAPDITLPDTPSYVRWVMLMPPGTTADMPRFEADPQVALRAVLDLMDGWHPELRALIEDADARNSGIGPLRTADPLPSWDTGPVTLLGDAGHPVPPGGLGANLAFVDAESLTATLTAVRDDGVDLDAALAAYQEQVRANGRFSAETANNFFASLDSLRDKRSEV